MREDFFPFAYAFHLYAVTWEIYLIYSVQHTWGYFIYSHNSITESLHSRQESNNDPKLGFQQNKSGQTF